MELSSEQKALIPIFTKKWLDFAFSTDAINQERARQNINDAYAFLGYSEPEIIFFKNIESVAQSIQPFLEARITNLKLEDKEPTLKKIGNKLGKPLIPHFHCLYSQLCIEVGSEDYFILRDRLGLDLYKREKYFDRVYGYTTYNCSEQIKQNLNFEDYKLKFISAEKLKAKLEAKLLSAVFFNNFYTNKCLFIDYCNEVLNTSCDLTLWNILRRLCADCGLMLIPFQSVCLVCDRHKILNSKQS